MTPKILSAPGSNTPHELRDKIRAAKLRLRDRFKEFKLLKPPISDYNQRYLSEKIARLDSVLDLNEQLFLLSFTGVSVPLRESVFLDYGGGSGFASFFAREIGVGKVLYSDIYDVSCNDVKVLADAIGYSLDHVICGDIDDVVTTLTHNNIHPNVVASYDVIEHIYDVEDHFAKLSRLAKRPLRVVYASSANIENARIVRMIRHKQEQAESVNREKQWGDKERDSLNAFFDIRKKIISEYAPNLSSSTVDELSRLTRGLIKSDIEDCVIEYQKVGRISYAPKHPSNTCDPYTGNWCEHLMDLRWLQDVIERAGFEVRFVPGLYPVTGSLSIKALKRTLNLLIGMMGRSGMRLAPYYALCADHKAN